MTQAQEQVWRQVATVLVDEDVLGLVDEHPDPVEEYRPEAEDIVSRVRSAQSDSPVLTNDQIVTVIIKVFEHWFEVTISHAKARQIAKRIERLLLLGVDANRSRNGV